MSATSFSEAGSALNRPGLLKLEHLDRIEVITFDRADVLNCFSRQMYRAIAAVLAAAAEDAEVAVVVMTGAGRAYCSGVDLKDRADREREPGDHDQQTADFERFVNALNLFPKPLICAVNGLAVGIGATMLGLADLVLMSDTARIRLPFASISRAPEAGSTYTFPAMIGHQAAAWLMYSGAWLSADECQRLGLAWRVCPADDLLPEVMRCAQEIASQPIDAVIEAKGLITASRLDQVAAARQREAESSKRLGAHRSTSSPIPRMASDDK